MDTCETVAVKSENKAGRVFINKADFDPKKHALYEESKPSEAASKQPQNNGKK